MSFEHEQITLPNYVLLECQGEFSVAGMMAKLTAAFDAAKEADRQAVLIDLRAVEGPTPGNRDYGLLAELNLGKGFTDLEALCGTRHPFNVTDIDEHGVKAALRRMLERLVE